MSTLKQILRRPIVHKMLFITIQEFIVNIQWVVARGRTQEKRMAAGVPRWAER